MLTTSAFAGISAVWIWVAIAVVMGVVEAFTLGLTTIWFAGGALAAAVVALVTDNTVIQILVFVVVSLVLAVITRPLALKKLNKNTEKTNIHALIGESCIAESDIAKFSDGSVKADGKVWTAVIADDSDDIAKGDVVEIVDIKGVKLIVRKRKGE